MPHLSQRRRELLHAFGTQINCRMGSPNVAGSQPDLSAGMSSGSTCEIDRPTSGSANPPLRQWLGIEVILAAIDRRSGETRNLRDQGETATTSASHLGRRKQPTGASARFARPVPSSHPFRHA
jgi:hypothetical protein